MLSQKEPLRMSLRGILRGTFAQLSHFLPLRNTGFRARAILRGTSFALFRKIWTASKKSSGELFLEAHFASKNASKKHS